MKNNSPYKIYVEGDKEEDKDSGNEENSNNNNIKQNKKIQINIKVKNPTKTEKSIEKEKNSKSQKSIEKEKNSKSQKSVEKEKNSKSQKSVEKDKNSKREKSIEKEKNSKREKSVEKNSKREKSVEKNSKREKSVEKNSKKNNDYNKNSKYFKREYSVLTKNHLRISIKDTKKNDKGEEISNENESDKEEEESDSNNIPKNNKNNNYNKKEKKGIKTEKNKSQDIKRMKENIKSIYAKAQSSTEKLQELLNRLKNDIQDNNNKRQDYDSKLNDIHKETKSQIKLKKTIITDMKNLEDFIIEKLDKIEEYRKLKQKRGHNSVERSNKKLFIYNSSEDLIKIKQKQLKNVVKLNNIVDKDITNLYTNLKRGYYVDQDIQEEKPKITTKKEELFYIYTKINIDVSKLKNKVQLLRHIKDVHNNCDKTIFRLNKELNVLKEKKDRKNYYNDYLASNKEMNEIKRKQIIANKGLDLYKHRFALKKNNNRYRAMRTISQDSRYSINKIKNKIQLVIPKEKNYNNLISNNYNDISLNESYNNDNNNDKDDNDDNNNDNDDNSENSNTYKLILQTKMKEKNALQRKYYSIMKELEQFIIQKETELKEKESIKKNLLKNNFYLQNTQKFNEEKIKKLKKQLNELELEVKNYDEQLYEKEGEIDELKDVMNDIKKFQK